MTELSKYYATLPAKVNFQIEVAKQCRVSAPTVFNWIRGLSRPKLESHLVVLESFTKIPKERLFEEVEPSNN